MIPEELEDKLDYLADTKELLRQKLNEKGVTVSSSDTFRSYATKILELPAIAIVSIEATYTQSGTVYDTDTLDSLKSDLVVTATYNNGTTETITDYTLSGTLTAGTSTITVAYESFTDTFDVTVSEDIIYEWDFTESLIDKCKGQEAVLNGSAVYTQGTGIVITTKDDWVYFGEILKNGLTIEIDFTDFYVQSGAYSKLLIATDNFASTFGQRRYSSTLRYWNAYNNGWLTYSTPRIEVNNLFYNSTAKFIFNDDNDFEVYANDDLKYKGENFVKGNNYHDFNIGINDGRSVSTMTITGVRVYANR